jgi:hypothetical protein
MSLKPDQKRFLTELLASFSPLSDATYLIYDYESLAVRFKLPALTLHPRILPVLFAPGMYVAGIFKAFYLSAEKISAAREAAKDPRAGFDLSPPEATTYSQYELYMYWWTVRCMLSERFNYAISKNGLTLEIPSLEEKMLAVGEYDTSKEGYSILWAPSMLLGTYSEDLDTVFTESLLGQVARFYHKFVSQLLICNDELPPIKH